MKMHTTTIVNLAALAPGAVRLVNHPAMPEPARLQDPQVESWCLLHGDKLGAICSLWPQGLPARDGHRAAALGHFFAQGHAAGVQLLAYACQRLAAQGFTQVIGPLDGDTWHRYRLVTVPREQPPFFLEYYTPCSWPAIFTDAGFAPIATYTSARTTTADYHDPSAAKFARKVAQLGITLRTFEPARAQQELAALYALSSQSFAHNLLYTPIALEEFLALYLPLLPYLNPDLFLLAEAAGVLVGYVLALPDHLQRARGEVSDTLIIKTLARHPDRRYAGLGSYLGQAIHQRGAALGYRYAIHALMHDANVSLTISAKSAQPIRRYALYGKKL